MNLFRQIKDALTPKPFPLVEFGMDDMRFFIALLRACPPASRIAFDQSEPESFVHAFRKWSHRADPKSFEADNYTIDNEFIALAEQLARSGKLELYCHFGISSPEGELLCTSWDDFMILKLAEDLKQKIRAEACGRVS
jgi:hypothetical protein